MRNTIAEQYKRAKGHIQDNRTKMDALAEMLLKIETMSAEEFAEIFDGGKRKRIKKAKREGKQVEEKVDGEKL